MGELNSGLVYTTEKCIGCNKCISVCPVQSANVVVKDIKTGYNVVKVDPDKCIECGNCIKECGHNARNYRDDTKNFFRDLVRGEKISLLVAPSFKTNYPKQYKNILGYLKHLGVRNIYDVSAGADIATWFYTDYLQKNNINGSISPTCPVVVNYIERYKPELIHKLIPVPSATICTAIYVRRYLKNNDKLAFISPCIAKKNEIKNPNAHEMVSYNVTFSRLVKTIKEVEIDNYSADSDIDYGLGAIYPMAGGLTKNIEMLMGYNNIIKQIQGKDKIFRYLDSYCKKVTSGNELPFLIDILNCDEGCICGTGTQKRIEFSDTAIFEIHNIKESIYKKKNENVTLSPYERRELTKKMYEDLDPNDFIRHYNEDAVIVEKKLSRQEIDSIFESMYKYTDEDRRMDCSSCGYKFCINMVNAIGHGYNTRDNCIFYAQEKMIRENQQNESLLNHISVINDELKKSSELKSNFLANMSHEIRTPMNAVIGMAEMALRGDLGKREREYITQIKASGRNLLSIINGILDISKVESGKLELQEVEYEILTLINDVINIINMRIQEKDIQLIIDINPNIPQTLLGDDIRLREMIINLANNAVKFTQKGMIAIKLDYDAVNENLINLKVSVEDTGMGIKKEDLSKLFVAFQQVDSKRNRNVEGTGLGLAITKMFTSLMNGEINVESEYGKGTTFSFYIPQKIINKKSCINVENVDSIKACSFIRNNYIRQSLQTIMDQLNIDYIECQNDEELLKLDISNITHIFVNDIKNNIKIEEFIKDNSDKKVIIINDPRYDSLSSDSAVSLRVPISTKKIAQIFNKGEIIYDDGMSDKDDYTLFEAPEAEILIVDDNLTNITVAQGLLEPLKMKITTATSGKEAIELVKNKKFDLICMDHMMPEMDGIEATNYIRNLDCDYCRNIPIIALTANAVSGAKKMFLENGMNDFVAKPIEMNDIITKLRKWIPKEKITSSSIKNNDADKEEVFPEIEGLDTKLGLSFTKNSNLYKQVLKDYHKDIKNKADLIEKYEAENNIDGYRIEVHALKSSSKVIGAIQLSELAAYLEKCAETNNIEEIQSKTKELLNLYRSYIEILSPYDEETIMNKNGEKLSKDELESKLNSLSTALDAFNFENADKLINELKTFLYDADDWDTLLKMSDAVENIEYDECNKLIKIWLDNLNSKNGTVALDNP